MGIQCNCKTEESGKCSVLETIEISYFILLRRNVTMFCFYILGSVRILNKHGNVSRQEVEVVR